MPLERHTTALASQVEVVATMDIGVMWDRYLGEFLGKWTQLERQGVTEAAMEAEMLSFMEGLSDKPVVDLGRQSSSVVYNQGRAAEQLSAFASGAAEFVVRSEILDSATCEVCANLDSSVWEIDSPDYHEYMPPAKCLGGDRCRGFYVTVAGEAAA